MKNYIKILIPIFILNIISILYLPYPYNIKQLIYIILSIITYILIIKLNKKIIIKLIKPFYILNIILLLITLLYSKYTNGSRGWINLGIINIQPSELTKISLILITYYKIKYNNKHILIIYLIPIILTYLEPDTGSIIIYIIIYLSSLKYLYNKKTIYKLIILTIIIILSIIILYLINKNLIINLIGSSIYYRIDRLLSFINKTNLQTNNALISIGSNKLLYFPEYTNDFFLSYILSSTPTIFYIILLSYIYILYILIINNNYISNTTYYILSFMIIENIGMNLSILPVIGIPLPFLSYGGSNLITNYILISLSNKKMSKDI